MKRLVISVVLMCSVFCVAVCASQNSTEVASRRDGRLISGVSGMLARFAFRKLLLKFVRGFAQYFVDIFLGEVIGARGLPEDTWKFQWPSWLTPASVDTE